MKKLMVIGCVLMMAIVFGTGNSLAESAKATCSFGDIATVDNTSLRAAELAPIFTSQIKTAEAKDLFIDVSLECGLTTNTKVVSKALEKAVSEATAQVIVWVEVDGQIAEPGQITFARRSQALIAQFAGDITSCLDADGHLIIDDGSCIQAEELALILDTMNANSFNFIAPNVAVGEHTIDVYAQLSWASTGDFAQDVELEFIENPVTRAYLGHGSVTVEEVRMVK